MKRNIYIRLRGGLGNQLFQYAYAVALDKDNQANKILDIREYESYKTRNFEICNLVLDSNTRINEEKRLKYDAKIKIFHFSQFIRQKLRKAPLRTVNFKLAKRGYVLCGRSAPLINFDLPADLYLYGYFQNVAPLISIRDKLCNYFSIKETSNTEYYKYKEMIDESSIAISIRCGLDAAKSFTLPDKDFYICVIRDLIKSNPNRQLAVYCDDIDYVIENEWLAEFENVVYVRNCSPCEQMQLMRLSKDYIISNSSFSWWGAFLGAYGKKSKVYAPKVWYKNVPIQDTDLMFDDMVIL